MKDLAELLEVASFKIAGQDYEIDMEKYLHVDSTNLNYEFERHTKLVAIVGFAHERAMAYAQKLEVELDRIYALCDARARNSAALDGGKKPTEAMVEGMAKTAQEYQEHQNLFLEARQEAGLLKALREAMAHRKDVLVGLGASYRAEIGAEISLSHRHFDKR
jgi:hypothetical protein